MMDEETLKAKAELWLVLQGAKKFADVIPSSVGCWSLCKYSQKCLQMVYSNYYSALSKRKTAPYYLQYKDWCIRWLDDDDEDENENEDENGK